MRNRFTISKNGKRSSQLSTTTDRGGVCMVGPDYLRRQAGTCLKWAGDCFDLATATHLRLMAEEFLAKADEIEAKADLLSRMKSHADHDSPPVPRPQQAGGDAS
jgi:hypothetical protein